VKNSAIDFLDVPVPGADASWKIARSVTPSTKRGGHRPGLVWLGGFASDMSGTKAVYLETFARQRGQAFLRFDYSGHGASHGRFDQACIGDWLAQSIALMETSTTGQQILIGSSMGGWIALLMARYFATKGTQNRLAGLVLLAPAVDFTETLIWARLDEPTRCSIMENGFWARPSDYSPEPTPITRRLIEEGRQHLLFGNIIRSYAPVHILQGMSDLDVPWRHALKIVAHLSADPTTLTLVSEGDHRLSRESDLALLARSVELMTERFEQSAGAWDKTFR